MGVIIPSPLKKTEPEVVHAEATQRAQEAREEQGGTNTQVVVEKPKQGIRKTSPKDPNDCEPEQYWAKEPPHKCIDKPTPVKKVVKPSPSAVPRAISSGSCQSEIAKYDWDKSVALAVARAESGLNPRAHGDRTLEYVIDGVAYGSSYGCFQIRYLPGRPAPSNLLNASFNVKYAYDMYKSSGWSPWSAYTNGSYASYL